MSWKPSRWCTSTIGAQRSNISAAPHGSGREEVRRTLSSDHVDKRGWNDRAQLRLIWGLVLGVALFQLAIWIVGGASGIAVAVRLAAGWAVAIALGILASRRIGILADRLTEREHAHKATLDEVQQLQT